MGDFGYWRGTDLTLMRGSGYGRTCDNAVEKIAHPESGDDGQGLPAAAGSEADVDSGQVVVEVGGKADQIEG